jgi:hypothetical protein
LLPNGLAEGIDITLCPRLLNDVVRKFDENKTGPGAGGTGGPVRDAIDNAEV